MEWYRTVDAAKLEHLKEMMAADNYKENLGTLIRLIRYFLFNGMFHRHLNISGPFMTLPL